MPPPVFDTREFKPAGLSSAKRPAAPISAGAFAFNISGGTPKRVKPNHSKNTVIPLRPPSSTPSKETSWTPLCHDVPVPQEGHTPKGGPSLITPKKTYRALDALPSPFTITPKSAHKDKSSHKPLNSLLDESSPFRPKSEPVSITQGDKLVRLGQITAGKLEEIPRERIKREDEGIGVSPRKQRGMKWNGKGPMPASVQLANLLQTANSSLLLFYTSLQRTLMPPSRVAQGSLRPGPTLHPPTPIQHLRKAPLVLRAKGLVSKRTHNGTMLLCGVISFKRGDAEIAGLIGRIEDESFPEDGRLEMMDVILVLQPVPHECPRLGMDPKVIVGKLVEGTEKVFEIGIWSPVSDLVVSARSERGLQGDIECSDPSKNAIEEEGVVETQHNGTEGNTKDQAPAAREIQPNKVSTRYVFAARYLIAEATTT